MSDSPVQAAVLAAQRIARQVTGIAKGDDQPPEKLVLGKKPQVVGYPGPMVFDNDAVDGYAGHHEIVVEMHVPRSMSLPVAVALCLQYSDSIPAAWMADKTLGGAISTFDRVEGEFTALDWGDQQTFGFRWRLKDCIIL